MALGVAFMATTSLAHAQTVETVMTPPPPPVIIAQQPLVAPPPTVVVAQPAQTTVPLETVETVRTVQSARPAKPRIARRSSIRRGAAPRVTTTRTIVRQRFIPAPTVAIVPPTPAVAAIIQPAYTEVVEPPVSGPLYDVVPAAAVAPTTVVAPPAVGAVVAPLPAYRYVYEPNRILVIDANTGIAVQAIPR